MLFLKINCEVYFVPFALSIKNVAFEKMSAFVFSFGYVPIVNSGLFCNGTIHGAIGSDEVKRTF